MSHTEVLRADDDDGGGDDGDNSNDDMMITGLSKMDYQSPYFQLRLSLDHLMPGNH